MNTNENENQVNPDNLGNVNNESVSPDMTPHPEIPDMDVTGENTVVIEKVNQEYDPDEVILAEFFDNGKTKVTTNDLLTAGFDTSRMKSFTFQVGRYKLSRQALVSPYIIERCDI